MSEQSTAERLRDAKAEAEKDVPVKRVVFSEMDPEDAQELLDAMAELERQEAEKAQSQTAPVRFVVTVPADKLPTFEKLMPLVDAAVISL